jgi:hypothetical protein
LKENQSPYNLHTIFTQFPHLTFPSYNSSFLLDSAGFPGRRLTGTGSVIYRGQAFGLFGIQEQRKPTPLILKEAALGSAFRSGWCRSRRIAAPAVNRRLSREPAPGHGHALGGQRAVPACQCTMASRGLVRYPPSIPAATSAESIRWTRSPSPAVGAALTICWVWKVVMSWQVTAPMTGAANLRTAAAGCGFACGTSGPAPAAGRGPGSARSGPRRAAPCSPRRPTAAR